MAEHEKRIALVDKNVLNAQTRQDAIGYFARKFDRQGHRKNSLAGSKDYDKNIVVVSKRIKNKN